MLRHSIKQAGRDAFVWGGISTMTERLEEETAIEREELLRNQLNALADSVRRIENELGGIGADWTQTRTLLDLTNHRLKAIERILLRKPAPRAKKGKHAR
jgi:hypothetical protein